MAETCVTNTEANITLPLNPSLQQYMSLEVTVDTIDGRSEPVINILLTITISTL